MRTLFSGRGSRVDGGVSASLDFAGTAPSPLASDGGGSPPAELPRHDSLHMPREDDVEPLLRQEPSRDRAADPVGRKGLGSHCAVSRAALL